MAFDWQTFLDRQGIDYTVQKKDLYIHCPFCGGSDSGRHMGISTVGRGWGCWRQNTHRGKAPERLVQALTGCSFVEAQRITGRGAGAALVGPGAFMAAVEGALGKTPPAPTPSPLVKPKAMHRLRDVGSGVIFWDYLERRGFTTRQVRRLIDVYDLHYAITGDWAYRLVLPVPDEKGNWYTWTARAITDHAKVRYKTLTADPDKAKPGDPVARGPITDMLLDLPRLFKGGRTLVVAEGPFDAMRLAMFTDDYNARATCLFGKAISNAQVELLARLRPLYDDIVLVLDPDAAFDVMELQTRLAPVGVLSHLLRGEEDPGGMSASAIRDLMRALPTSKGYGVMRAAARKGD